MEFSTDLKRKPTAEYVVVVDFDGSVVQHTVHYTQVMLKSALQLAGCKTRIAHKATKMVFRALGEDHKGGGSLAEPQPAAVRRSLSLSRGEFRDMVSTAIRKCTDNPVSNLDLQIAYSIREQCQCVIIFMAGTSGCGKSTLASLLASKMGITTVVSTDSIRNLLRSFTCQSEDPVMWASTYQAGEVLPHVPAEDCANGRPDAKQKIILGYKAQCAAVMERVEQLVAKFAGRRDSLIVEGVHLRMKPVVRIMAAHPCVVPFHLHISNEAKHRERFAVRSKYMTLDPGANRYVKHFRQIRVIQNYLTKGAERHCIPRVDNTNVDRSVAAIHATILSCLRRQAQGETILDPVSKTARPLAADYEQCKQGTCWSSKTMLKQIQSRKAAPELGRGPGEPSGYGTGETLGSAQQSCIPSRLSAAPEASLEAGTARDEISGSEIREEGSVVDQRADGGSTVGTELEDPEDDDYASRGIAEQKEFFADDLARPRANRQRYSLGQVFKPRLSAGRPD